MSLEDFSSSPPMAPRLVWVRSVGTPGIFVVPLVVPALICEKQPGTMDLAAIGLYRAVNLIKSTEDGLALIIGVLGVGYLGIQLFCIGFS